MPSQLFDQVRASVQAKQTPSGQWAFRCPLPSHGKGRGDRQPSAVLFEDDRGRMGVHCYAGCWGAALWEHVVVPFVGKGAKWRDAADDAIVAVYAHPDGRPRKVFRKECLGGPSAGCTFKGCQNTEPAKHIWQSKGANAGCYVLLWPEDGPDPVVLVEGEKSAKATAAAGFTAASWLGGASRAGQADYSPLKGRKVYVMPDNDPPGFKAAQTAMKKAMEWALSVELLPPADGKPGADAADLTVAQLQAHVEAGGQPFNPDVTFAVVKGGADRPFGPLDLTPYEEAGRFVQAHGRGLLFSWDSDLRATIHGDNGFGVWSLRAEDLHGRLAELAKARARAAVEGYLDGQVPADDHREALRWAKRGLSVGGWDDTFKAMAAKVYRLDVEGRLPAGLEQTRDMELDVQRRYIGAPNGVVDLDTGDLLCGAEARSKYVTRSIPDPYEPDAHHPAVDALLAHLPSDNAAWILSALGYALRGNPTRRIYVLEGPPGGGKTTLLNAVRAALGTCRAGGYSFTAAGGALVRDDRQAANAHSGHLVDFTAGRIATVSELPVGRRLDTPLLKRVSGTEFLPTREVGQKAGPEKLATATMFIAVNTGGLEVMDLTDEGLYARVRVLPYPPLDRPADVGLAERVVDEPRIRQAMFALLVRHAIENRTPPVDVPDVAQAREAAQEAAFGEAGEWIRAHIVRARSMDRLLTSEAWNAAVAASGDASGAAAWGLDRLRFMKRVRAIQGMLPAKRFRTRAGMEHGWLGWQLLTDEQVAAGTDGLPACAGCGLLFEQLMAEAYCQDCIGIAEPASVRARTSPPKTAAELRQRIVQEEEASTVGES